MHHTKHIAKHFAQAQAEQMKRVVDKVFAEAERLFGHMALHKMKAKDTDQFLELVIPRTARQKQRGEEPERWKRVKAILQDEKVTPSKTKDTLWALYNAIVRDEDYRESRAEERDSRLDRVWFGTGNNLKLRALQAAAQQVRRAA